MQIMSKMPMMTSSALSSLSEPATAFVLATTSSQVPLSRCFRLEDGGWVIVYEPGTPDRLVLSWSRKFSGLAIPTNVSTIDTHAVPWKWLTALEDLLDAIRDPGSDLDEYMRLGVGVWFAVSACAWRQDVVVVLDGLDAYRAAQEESRARQMHGERPARKPVPSRIVETASERLLGRMRALRCPSQIRVGSTHVEVKRDGSGMAVHRQVRLATAGEVLGLEGKASSSSSSSLSSGSGILALGPADYKGRWHEGQAQECVECQHAYNDKTDNKD